MTPWPPCIPGLTFLRRIGRGGYGEVWLRETSLGQARAIKLVRRDFFDEARPYERELGGLKKFEPISREHPGLVDILQIEVATDQSWFACVMELADDLGPIDDKCATARTVSADYAPHTLRSEVGQLGRLPVRRCLEVATAILDALAYLHHRNLVHRDVKPSNILVVDGRTKLGDVGLVASTGEARSLVGTPAFLPPEGAGTPSGDLYALGKTLYAAATGREPLDVAALPESVTGWSDHAEYLELQEVVFRASAVSLMERYPSAAAMAADIALIGRGGSLRREQAALRRATQFRRWAMVATAGLILLGGLALWERHLSGRIRSAEEEARRNLLHALESNGIGALDSNDLPMAGLWILEALKHARTPDEEWRQRKRLGGIFRHSPVLEHIGFSPKPINQAIFSPDGQRILTAGANGGARIWDAHTFEPVTSEMLHEGEIRQGMFSSDSQLVVTAGVDGSARIWDAVSGHLQLTLRHSGQVNIAAFSPRGLHVVTAGEDGVCQLWNGTNGLPTAPPLRHGGPINTAVFSPDGTLVLTASDDDTAQLWNVATGERVGGTVRHRDDVRCACFSPDGRYFATGGKDGVAQIWNVPTATPAAPAIHHLPIYAISFSPDGQRLLTAGGSHSIGEARIWKVSTGEPVNYYPMIHGSEIRHVGWSSGGRFFAAASADRTVRIWHGVNGKPISPPMAHGDRVWTVNPDPNNELRWVTGGRDGCWRVWSVPDPRVATWEVYGPNRTAAAEVSDDERSLLYADEQHFVLLDDPFGRRSKRFTVRPESPLRRAILNPGATRVFTLHDDGTAQIWDALTGRPLCPPRLHWPGVGFAAFSPSGRWVVTAGGNTARVWDGETGEPRSEPMVHESPVWVSLFTSDEKTLVTGSGSRLHGGPGAIRFWRGTKWSSPTAEPQPGTVIKLALSPDGRTLASACADETSSPLSAQLWSPDGRRIGPPLMHGDGVSALAFSSDSRVLVTGSEEGEVCFWQTISGSPIGDRIQLRNGITDLAFSSDGRQLVIMQGTKPFQLWDPITRTPLSPTWPNQLPATRARFSRDGRWLLSSEEPGKAPFTPQLHNLDPVTNSIVDLERIIRGLAGRGIDHGTIVPLTGPDLIKLGEAPIGRSP